MAKHYRPFRATEPSVTVDTEKPHDVKEDVSAIAEKIQEKVAAKAEATKEEKNDKPKLVRIICDLANIRKLPSMNSEIVCTVTKGAEFKAKLENSKDGFTGIIVNGADAFIKSDLIEVFDNPVYVAHDKAGTLGV